MKSFVIGGLLSEAWVRSKISFNRSIDLYHQRIRLNQQPRFGLLFDVFNYKQQFRWLPIICLSYILITYFIRSYMNGRSKGFKIRWLMVLFNLINVISNAYIIYTILSYKLQGGMLLCNGLSTDAEGLKLSTSFALFYFNKLIELLGTWILLLRKSSKQVTSVHLFHHIAVVIVSGIIIPFEFNGDMYLPVLLNSFTHLLIYSNYLLGTFGFVDYWAPFIFSAQLAQFVAIYCHSLLSYRIGPTCGAPDFAKLLVNLYSLSLLFYFIKYFVQKFILGYETPSDNFYGVIKRPIITVNIEITVRGTVQLDDEGNGIVSLPSNFPSAERMSSRSLLYKPFEVNYQLTALEVAMPQLHVSGLAQSRQDNGYHSKHISESTLYFQISGGVARGSVSWMVSTVPINRSNNSYNNKR